MGGGCQQKCLNGLRWGVRARGLQGKKSLPWPDWEWGAVGLFCFFFHSHFRPLRVQAKVKCVSGCVETNIWQLKSKTAHQQFSMRTKQWPASFYLWNHRDIMFVYFQEKCRTIKMVEYSVCMQPWNCLTAFMHKETAANYDAISALKLKLN